jgi:hypothetical protein
VFIWFHFSKHDALLDWVAVRLEPEQNAVIPPPPHAKPCTPHTQDLLVHCEQQVMHLVMRCLDTCIVTALVTAFVLCTAAPPPHTHKHTHRTCWCTVSSM